MSQLLFPGIIMDSDLASFVKQVDTMRSLASSLQGSRTHETPRVPSLSDTMRRCSKTEHYMTEPSLEDEVDIWLSLAQERLRQKSKAKSRSAIANAQWTQTEATVTDGEQEEGF